MRKTILVLTPLFGILLFSVLYVVATFYYPGGSQADKSTKGFDWLNNYWCDLTDQLAMNGETNSARPIALTAILILLSTLAIFWYYLPHIFQNSKYSQIIRYAGITSMTVSIFVFTRSHVTALNIAGIFGIIALIGTFIELYKNKLPYLFGYGLFCLAVILLNYIIFDTGWLYSFLPLLQKVAFVLFLLWICMMDIYLYRITKLAASSELNMKN